MAENDIRSDGGTLKVGLRPLSAGVRSATVGVHVEPDGLRMVKVVPGRPVEFRRAPIGDGTGQDAQGLATALKLALTPFLGRDRRAGIWVACPFTNLQVRHFRIPRVPARQLSNAVYWSLRRESPAEEKDVVFDYVVEGEVVDEGARKLAVTTYTVDRKQVEQLRAAFGQAGLGLAGITLPLFALRNLFMTGWIPVSGGSTLCLHMGEEESDITIFSGRNVAITRGIKTGARALADLVAHGAAGGMTPERARDLVFGLAREAGAEAAQHDGEPGADEVMRMIEPGLVRLARQIEQTVASQLGRGIEQVSRICVSGRPWMAPAVREFMERELGIGLELIDPLASRAAVRAAPVVGPADATPLFAVAAGLAVSSSGRTPNLLYTHKEKERDDRARRINMGILAVFVLGMAALLVGFLWQGMGLARARWRQSAAEAKLRTLEPRLDRNRITAETADACQKLAQLKAATRDHILVAAVGELAALTPAAVRLQSIEVKTVQASEPAGGAPPAPADESKVAAVSIEGFVTGPVESQGAWLAKYLLDLEASPVLSGVKLTRDTVAPKTGEGGTSFALAADVSLPR